MEEHRQNWDFSQVDEYIFVGADLCCGREHYDYLQDKMGIKVDINLRKEEDFSPGPLAGGYLWLPVTNLEAPSNLQMILGAAVIEAAVKAKERVFVHCTFGHGRSPTMVAGYYILKKGLGVEAAIEKIKRGRGELHLTEAQMEALRKLS
jgi:hypothetical protein